MTAKDFFQQAFRAYRNIDSKLEQLARLRELTMRTTSALSGIPNGGNDSSSKLESAVVALHMAQAKLGTEIEKLLAVWNEVAAAIAEVTDADERLVLEYRYLAFESWQTIATKMRLSVDRIYFLHREALKNFRQFQQTTANASKQQQTTP